MDPITPAQQSLALSIARRWRKRLPPSVLLADLEQAALLGLWDWVRRHPDPTDRGYGSGMRQRIAGSVIDELRQQDWLPRRARQNQAGGLHYARELSVYTYGELSEELEGSYLRDHRPSPEELAIRAIDDPRALACVLSAPLDPVDREVIQLRLEDKQQNEIAPLLGMSDARVSQRDARALRVMRAHLAGKCSIGAERARRRADILRRTDTVLHALARLTEGGGKPPSSKEVSLASGIKPGSLRWHLSRLIALGLVVRRRGRRGRVLQLTLAGRARSALGSGLGSPHAGKAPIDAKTSLRHFSSVAWSGVG